MQTDAVFALVVSTHFAYGWITTIYDAADCIGNSVLLE